MPEQEPETSRADVSSLLVKTSFTPSEPVGIGEIVEIVARAIEVFGDRTKALRWLRTPIPSLGDRTPEEMLECDGGIEQVEEVLGRIEHGVW
jgi:putative toxin-antitoxin system antitoxin component (TIGR02293 family)